MAAEVLRTQAAQLQAAVARHKAEIRRHRAALSAAAARLRDLEATCRRLGIAMIHKPTGVEEQSSWPVPKPS